MTSWPRYSRAWIPARHAPSAGPRRGYLPDDPSPGQGGTWMELAGLVGDRRLPAADPAGDRVLAFSCRPGRAGRTWPTGPPQHAVAALLRGCPPGSAEAAEVVNRILEPDWWKRASGREELLAGLEVLSDPPIKRYWQLTAIINGLPPFPSHMPGDLWLLAALRAYG